MIHRLGLKLNILRFEYLREELPDKKLHQLIFDRAPENRNYFYKNITFYALFCNERFSFLFARFLDPQTEFTKKNKNNNINSTI